MNDGSPRDLSPTLILAPARHLEELWERGERPDVDQLLAATAGLAPPIVAEALAVDQWRRWHAGERIPAEDYLRRYPILEADPEHALELIYGEFLVREELGEAPTPEEYCRRFPGHANQLRQQFAVGPLLNEPTSVMASRRAGARLQHGGSQPALDPVAVPGRRRIGGKRVAIVAAGALTVILALYGYYQAHLYRKELRIVHDQLDLHERTAQALCRTRDHEEAGNWEAALNELITARTAVDAQPDPRADDLRTELQRREDGVRQQRRSQEARQQARHRLDLFHPDHDVALIYDTLYDGTELIDRRAKTLAAARSALAVYGLETERNAAEGGPSVLECDRPYHTEDEHARLIAACHELVHIWAEAEAAPPRGPAESETQIRQRAATALAVLDRAPRLAPADGVAVRAHDRLRARLTARSQGLTHSPAASAPKTDALDRCLEGLEQYQAGEFDVASEACRASLALRNDFGTRYLLALCELRRSHWVSARDELTACVAVRPTLVWPRLFRAVAASEIGVRLADPETAAEEFAAAEGDFDRVLRQDWSPLVQYVGLSHRGAMNVRRQRWPEAVADLREARLVNPDGASAAIDLAIALQGLGKGEEGLALLARARQPELYEGRARLHLLRGEREAALHDAALAEQSGPLSDRVLYALARLHARAGAQLQAEARNGRTVPDPELLRRAGISEEKALDMLSRSLEQMPPGRRASFWREQVDNDPALTTVRGASQYSRLAARYGGTKR
jgi:tetratricopeptide (TPR) repeat protein